MAVPPTVLLPHKEHPSGTTDKSMRNLLYPLNWDEVFAYVGFPAFLKPFDGGGWRDVFQVKIARGVLPGLRPDAHAVHDAAAGRELHRVLPLLRGRPGAGARDALRPAGALPRALREASPGYPPALIERVKPDALTLCRALGYDLNTVEFAVEDGVPYAIDFMNPAPDADPHSVGPDNFEWIVDAVATLAVKKAQEPPGRRPTAGRRC